MKILVLDADPMVRNLVATVLKHASYEVLTASNSADALVICREAAEDVGLVISDVYMPEINGTEFAQCLLQSPGPVPVILMSGYPAATPGFEGLKGGRLDNLTFIAKPFRTEELLREVSLVLNGAS